MSTLTIRLSEDQEQLLTQLKEITYDNAFSKALLNAAKIVVQKLPKLEEQNNNLIEQIEFYKTSISDLLDHEDTIKKSKKSIYKIKKELEKSFESPGNIR